jgi:hypothetical protein
MPDTLPVSKKPLLMALQTALNRQFGADIFSTTDDGNKHQSRRGVAGKTTGENEWSRYRCGRYCRNTFALGRERRTAPQPRRIWWIRFSR